MGESTKKEGDMEFGLSVPRDKVAHLALLPLVSQVGARSTRGAAP